MADTHLSSNNSPIPPTLSLSWLNAMIQLLHCPPLVHDVLPVGPQDTILRNDVESTEQNPNATAVLLPLRVCLLVWFSTLPNIFGLYCSYLSQPNHSPPIPDNGVLLDDLISPNSQEESVRNIIHPFPNFSTFLLAHWFYTGGIQKSQNEWNCLVNYVLLAPGFFPDDLQGNSLNALDSALDWLDGPAHSMFEEGGIWIPCSLEISIPITCTGRQSQHYMCRRRHAQRWLSKGRLCTTRGSLYTTLATVTKVVGATLEVTMLACSIGL
jgi:hypothetical protein